MWHKISYDPLSQGDKCMHCKKHCGMKRTPIFIACRHFFCDNCTYDVNIDKTCRICNFAQEEEEKYLRLRQSWKLEIPDQELDENCENLTENAQNLADFDENLNEAAENQENLEDEASQSYGSTIAEFLASQETDFQPENQPDFLSKLIEKSEKILKIQPETYEFDAFLLEKHANFAFAPLAIRQILETSQNWEDWLEKYAEIAEFLHEIEAKRSNFARKMRENERILERKVERIEKIVMGIGEIEEPREELRDFELILSQDDLEHEILEPEIVEQQEILDDFLVIQDENADRWIFDVPIFSQADLEPEILEQEEISEHLLIRDENAERWIFLNEIHQQSSAPIQPILSRSDFEVYVEKIDEFSTKTGLMNAYVPAAYGGAGLSLTDTTLITEALSYGCSGIGLAVGGALLPLLGLLQHKDEAIKKKFCEMLSSGPNVAAMAVTEPTAGSNVGGIRTKAEKKGDEYVINGTKCWITGAQPGKFFVALARTNPDPKASLGKAFTMFVIDAKTPGIVLGKKEQNLGQRASDTRMVTFEDVRVPKENVIVGEGAGFGVCMNTFNRTRPFVGGIGCGISWRALDEAVKYATERETFGTKLMNHQGIQFMIADMAAQLEMFRLATYKAATMIDNYKDENFVYYASIAKLSSSDATQKITNDAVQVFGGAGFNKEYPVEKLMRDAKILQIYEGTSQIQRIIIARHVFENYQKTGGVLIR
ncbi:unnamed protein product [Caenorhabditis angaria]|uniref:RING-type domain-containing protein n=1 Tax=Caenorhabditis angaria TaxID=860376 RepID=A0A9P1I7U2_9PELO|nr:unnamed protein product [Caenorhabditis angaria]